MVGHETDGVKQNTRLLRGESQAVLNDLVGPPRWLQQELSLCATSGNEVSPTRQYLSRSGHIRLSVTDGSGCSQQCAASTTNPASYPAGNLSRVWSATQVIPGLV